MTVRCPKRLNCWNTMPILRLMPQRSARFAHMSWPRTVILPSVGVSSRLRQRRSVDLPVPEGPIMVITSPLDMEALTSVSGVALG